MIISHRHRYVFVELPRSGSTAVSRELREHYDGHEILRKHATYRDFLRQASDEEKKYFAFGGVRNPLDVAVSRYADLKANARGRFTDPVELAKRTSMVERLENRVYAWVQDNDADFEAFLRRWYVLPYDTWTSLDHHRFDMVLRFETLQQDFETAIRRIGLEPVRPLPVVNATAGRERNFESYYEAPGARRRATWVFGPYMKEWGYRFPESWGRVKVPTWSVALQRFVRLFRKLYWNYFRFADYVRRRPVASQPAKPDQPA